MKWRPLKYFIALLVPYSVVISFWSEGFGSFHALLVAFVIVPIAELFFKTDSRNLSDIHYEVAQKDRFYDFLLYLSLPLQIILMVWYLFIMRDTEMGSITYWGRINAYGILCGVMGINIAHELGHRQGRIAKFTSKALLFTSLYPHFYIEHNFGHHKHVGTSKDPATARYNENIYSFWIRSVIRSFISAWNIEKQRLKRQNLSFIQNEILIYLVIEAVMLITIYLVFGFGVLVAFIAGALTGILLLESVNYIEHYGLQRQKISNSRYENTGPEHSWNSDHVLGRLMLFELTRHSDHHANPAKKYQVLSHYEESPQLPTGYPGMILLALVPPLWFRVMNPRIKSARMLETANV